MVSPPSPAAPAPADRQVSGLLVLLLALLLAWVAWQAPPRPGAEDPVRLLAGGDGPLPAVIHGRLLSDLQRFGPSGAAGCRGQLETSGGRVELAFGRCPSLQEGWELRLEGQLRRLRPSPHPLLAGPAERLERQRIWCRLQVEQLRVLERPATPIADLRRRIAGRLIAAAGPERGGLLAALVLGSAVVPLPQALREAFRAAGLSHALAASGFHLSVLLGFVTLVGRPLGRWLRLLLAVAAILLFLLLAGPQPSVLRACLMGAIGVLLLECGRRGRPLALLGLTAALMLLLRPDWWRDVGFQLSVAATAGLLVTARPLEEWLQKHWPGGSQLDAAGGGDPGAGDPERGEARAGDTEAKRPARHGWRWLAGVLPAALAVPLAATLWTLPLQLLHFGALPLYAVPANMAASPLLTPLTLGAMALALVVLLAPPLLPLLLPPIDLLARLLLLLANAFAALPLAQWQTGKPLPLLVLLLALAMLGLLWPDLKRRWRRRAAALLALVVAAHFWLLLGDQLLLVHQGYGAGSGRDLLLARHRGRAALITNRADPYSCQQARQLASALGVARLDWALLLDPVAPAEPACWRRQAGLVLAYGEEAAPLLAGQRLASPGLAVQALSMDSHALELQLGRRRWLLLPDRQALWAWQASRRPVPEGVWLGFLPPASQRSQLFQPPPRQVWLSGAPPRRQHLPAHWRSSGASGSLQADAA